MGVLYKLLVMLNYMRIIGIFFFGVILATYVGLWLLTFRLYTLVNKSQGMQFRTMPNWTIPAPSAKVCSTEKRRSPLHSPIFCRRNCRNAFKFAFHFDVKSPARRVRPRRAGRREKQRWKRNRFQSGLQYVELHLIQKANFSCFWFAWYAHRRC